MTAWLQDHDTDSLLRVGTLNVHTLVGRVCNVIDIAEQHELDILALQEVKIPDNCLLAVAATASSRGWRFIPGDCDTDRAGKPRKGVAWLARWPVAAAVQPPMPDEFKKHDTKARVHFLWAH